MSYSSSPSLSPSPDFNFSPYYKPKNINSSLKTHIMKPSYKSRIWSVLPRRSPRFWKEKMKSRKPMNTMKPIKPNKPNKPIKPMKPNKPQKEKNSKKKPTKGPYKAGKVSITKHIYQRKTPRGKGFRPLF